MLTVQLVDWFNLNILEVISLHKINSLRINIVLIEGNLLFSKATTLEKTYGPAWIAYGHSFAVESEHDQAMAAYFTAAQLMKGYDSTFLVF